MVPVYKFGITWLSLTDVVKALVLVVERGYRYRSTPNSEFLCKRYWSTQSRDISNGLFTRSSAVAGFVAYSRPARDILWLPEHHE